MQGIIFVILSLEWVLTTCRWLYCVAFDSLDINCIIVLIKWLSQSLPLLLIPRHSNHHHFLTNCKPAVLQLCNSLMFCITNCYSLPHSRYYWGRGIVFDWFLCLSVSLSARLRKKTAGPICMKFSGKVWSDHGTTWLHFCLIPRNGATPR